MGVDEGVKGVGVGGEVVKMCVFYLHKPLLPLSFTDLFREVSLNILRSFLSFMASQVY